jgi:MFS-type transporter involved in bile tolerance (Atg22 family)
MIRMSTRPISRRTMALYSAASIGSGVFNAFNNFVLPLLLQGAPGWAVNLLSNTRSIEGTVVQPTIGAWSDRIWTHLGRRRPFMAVAIPLSALFIVLTPLAPNLGFTALCVFFFSLLYNIASDPYNALQADIAPERQRPLLNAICNVVTLVSQAGLLLALVGQEHIPAPIYPLVALVILVMFGITVTGVPEARDQVQIEPRTPIAEYVQSLRRHRAAARYLLALALYNIGVNTILVNLTRYATKVLLVSDGDALKLALVLVLLTGLFVVPSAKLAERVGMKPVLAGGLVLIAVAAALALPVQTPLQVLPILVVAGIGNGAYNALSWPMLTTLVPSQRAGVFAGLKSAAESISAFLSSFLAALLVAEWGYRSIFFVLLLSVAAALVALLTVRSGENHAQSGPEVGARTATAV